jgi:predicted alpha/beta-hydrolase family hydrolase
VKHRARLAGERTGEPQHWLVPVGSATTSAVLEAGDGGAADTLFVLAHGAGGHMSDRGMLAVSENLRTAGAGILRFNFLYREKNAGRPDPMPRLQECISSVSNYARERIEPRRLILGGRSMGGRAASMLVADGYACDALLLLAYPLHPAGKPGQLRDAHLPQIKLPVLCLNGTRDALCTRELMDSTIARLGRNWTMHWLAGADHSFHVLKASGRTDAEVLSEAGEAVGAWAAGLPPVPR